MTTDAAAGTKTPKATQTAYVALLAVLAAVLIAECLWAWHSYIEMWIWLPSFVGGVLVLVGAVAKFVSNVVVTLAARRRAS